ncbi:M20 family metallopeptidase [Pararhizobium sp. YC-54]|uniref:M20 metallopeptidase family protein n=1 Tax=Pararhizobium sp. YC-54 TaxID=2986920 RepID=UPI0021F6E8D7|nr:M20 family metallopeptidase [Pararhizobium sp. YC-54]MCW0001716.1 M20 family metallopeptidase [Pararhizobium sp. YC-54]
MSMLNQQIGVNGSEHFDLPAGSDERILALRHYMHENPELSNQEYRTQKKIAECLAEAGLMSPGIFHKTGLFVDILGEGNGIPLNVVVRGDIDALPINEARPDLPFRSRAPGKMHACGHDAHASAALGVVLAALAHRQHFAGKVRVVFQPAEEAEPLGGRSVAEQGLLDNFDCAVGMHVNPEIPSGTFSVLAGPVTKSSDEFQVIFKGRKSHAAWPELGVDAIAIAATFVTEVQKLISRETHADAAPVISIGRFHGGEATNIVCDHVVLDGTLRTRSPEARHRLRTRLEELAMQIATMHRGEVEFKLVSGEPAVVNDATISEVARNAIAEAFGSNSLVLTRPLAGADDFGFYAEKVPSVYFWFGCHNEALGNKTHVHTAEFGVSDDDVLRAARAAWAIVRTLQRSANEGRLS